MQNLTKIYSNLTDKEKASLAFSYVTQGDIAEHARIVSTVPKQSFTGLALEFRHWTENIEVLALLWAVEHWRTYSILLTARGGIATARDLCTPEFQQLIEHEADLSRRLIALDRVLADLCEEHRIDEASIRRFAGVLETFKSLEPMEPTSEQIAEAKAIMALTFS